MANNILKLVFCLFITLAQWNISLADVPNYWLVPEDGYVRPEKVDVELKWKKIHKGLFENKRYKMRELFRNDLGSCRCGA